MEWIEQPPQEPEGPINYQAAAQTISTAKLKQMAVAAADQEGVPRDLLLGYFRHESKWNPIIPDPNGDLGGLGQITPSFWADFGSGEPITRDDYDPRLHPGKNIMAIAKGLASFKAEAEKQGYENPWLAAIRRIGPAGDYRPTTKGDAYLQKVTTAADDEVREWQEKTSGKRPPGMYEAPEPSVYERVQDYLRITPQPKTTPLQIEAADKDAQAAAFRQARLSRNLSSQALAELEGVPVEAVRQREAHVSPFDIQEEVFGTGRVEEYGRVMSKFLSGMSFGVSDLAQYMIKGEVPQSETLIGAAAGAGAELAGLMMGPFKIIGGLTGNYLKPTQAGLRGTAQIMAHGGATLGLTMGLSRIIPAFLESDSLTKMALDVGKTTAVSTLIGSLYPTLGFIPGEGGVSKALRAATSLALMDYIRAEPGKFSTIPDVIQAWQDGTLSPKQLGERSFGYLMDLYFGLKVPSMRKQMQAIAQQNDMVKDLASLNADDIEAAILAARGQAQAPEKPQEAPGAEVKGMGQAPPTKPPGGREVKPGGEEFTMTLPLEVVPTQEIRLAPEIFQYKLHAEEGTGAGLALRDVKTWEEGLSGVMTLWRDRGGNLFMVNGHQRFALARQTGTMAVRAQILDEAQGWNQDRARAYGALINIAEGRGTEVDAAKFMRDMKYTAQDLADKGVSLNEAKTRRAVALSQLDDGLFHEVTLGRFDLEKAVVIGEYLPRDYPAQRALYQSMRQLFEAGKEVSNEKFREMVRLGSTAPKVEATQAGLFGVETITQSALMEKADLIVYGKKRFREDKSLFGLLGRKEKKITEAGNVLDPETNQQIARSNAEFLELFDKIAYLPDTQTNATLNNYAAKLAGAEKNEAAKIRTEFYKTVKEALAADYRTLFGTGQGPTGTDQGAGPGDVRPGGTGPQADGSGGVGASEVKSFLLDESGSGKDPLSLFLDLKEAYQKRLKTYGDEATADPLADRMYLVRRALPGATDEQVRIMAADPELFTQVARSGIAKAAQAKEAEAQAAQVSGRPQQVLEGVQGGDLFGSAPPDASPSQKRYSGGPETMGFIRRMKGFLGLAPRNLTHEELLYGAEKITWLGEKNLTSVRAYSEWLNQRDAIAAAVGEKKYGKASREADELIHLWIDLQRSPGDVEKYWDLFSDKQRAKIERAREIPNNPELLAIAERIRQEEDAIGRRSLEAGVIKSVMENHVNRIWDLEGKRGEEAGRKFGITSRHAREPVFSTIIEGWANDYKLKISSATEAQRILQEEMGNVVADRNFQNAGLKMGIFSPNQYEGWTKIEHGNFRDWTLTGKAEGDLTIYKGRRDVFADGEGNLYRRAEIYAPKEVADRINKILGTSALYKIPGVKALTVFNAVIKQTILTSALFHPQAFLRSWWLGVPGKEGMQEWSPRQAMEMGLQSIRELDPVLQHLVKDGGLTLFRIQDWESEMLRGSTAFGRFVDRLGPEDWSLRQKWNAIQDRFHGWVFGRVGAGLKAASAIIEYRNSLEKFPGMDPVERAQMVSKLVNANFGGINLAMKERDPTLQHLFRLAFLAPDWTESNFDAFTTAFKYGGAKEQAQWFTRFWASVFTKGIAITAAANLLLAFGDDKGPWERFKIAWDEGNLRWLDIDVTPIYSLLGGDQDKRKYFRTMGHFLDGVKMLAHPITFAHHKGSVLYRYLFEALAGRDWRGNVFTDLPELLGATGDEEQAPLTGKFTKPGQKGKGGPIGISQVPSYLGHEARQSLPIPVQNVLNFLSGEMDAWDAISKGVGTMTSSARPMSEAERLMMEDSRLRAPQLTPKQREEAQERRKLMEIALKEQDGPKFLEALNQARQDGKVTGLQYDRMKKDAAEVLKDPESGQFKLRFSRVQGLGTALKVFDTATPREKEAIAPLMALRWQRATPEKRAENQALFDAIRQKMAEQ